MEMPRPTEGHRMLERLAGKWVGDEKIFPTPWKADGGVAKGTATARMDLDGMFLVEDYAQEREGKVHYRGHGVFGHDPEDGTTTLYWFDSLGGGGPVTPARGRWEGDTLQLDHVGPTGTTRYTWQLHGTAEMTFRMDHAVDGRDWKPFLEARYRRT